VEIHTQLVTNYLTKIILNILKQHSQTADYVNKWKFTGHELDRETGLYYAKARYYDPKMSVFLSVDPMLEKYPSWSPYNYTLNNPINLVDPTGMEADDPPLGMPREHGTFYSDNTGSWKYDKHSDTWKGQNGSPDIDNAQNIQTVEVDRFTNGVFVNFNKSITCCHHKTTFSEGDQFEWNVFNLANRQSGYIQYGGELRSDFIGSSIGKDGVIYGTFNNSFTPIGDIKTKIQLLKYLISPPLKTI